MTADARAPRLTILLIGCYFVGFHLRLSLQSGSGATLVPMYSMLVPAALLALIGGSSLMRRVVPLAVGLLAFVLAQPILSLAPTDDENGSLLSAIQLFASVLAALAVINAARSVAPATLQRLFGVLWGTLISLATLENLFLRDLFSQVRDSLYGSSGRGIYASDVRDVNLYGQVRPSALASEPSFLADTYMTAAVLVFMLDKNRGSFASWARLVVMTVVGFLIAPSGKVVFYLAAAVVWHLWPRRTTSRVAAVLLGAGALTVSWFMFDSIADRLAGQVGLSETGSFYGRILIGPRVAPEALSEHPLMGYGIGNTSGLRPLIVQEWDSSGAFRKFPWFQGLDTSALMTNGLWWQWSFLGLLGGGIFVLLTVRMLSAVGVLLPWRTIVCTWIIWYSGAAFTDPASWCAFAAFAIPALGAGQDPERGCTVPSAHDEGLPRGRLRVDGADSDVAQREFIALAAET